MMNANRRRLLRLETSEPQSPRMEKPYATYFAAMVSNPINDEQCCAMQKTTEGRREIKASGQT